MPSIGLLYDPAVLDHLPPGGHPERPARVRETWTLLERSGILERLTRLPVHPATAAELARIHTPDYLSFVQQVAEEGGGYLDVRDTIASPGSWKAATAAAGAAVGAVDAVISGKVNAAFALVRPPGHHASADRAMGFCLLNNAAIAAAHAVVAHGLSRVLLVDFDVHHGNGTQDIFWETDQVLYFSTHQSPAYPHTGCWDEVGFGRGQGYTVNVPLPPGVGDMGFLQVFDRILGPLADRYQPEIVLVSAGYDAHWRNDAFVKGIQEQMTVTGLASLSARLQAIADRHCSGKIVGILEGGYDLEALAYGVLGTLRVWLGDQDIEDPLGASASATTEPDVTALLDQVRQTHQL